VVLGLCAVLVAAGCNGSGEAPKYDVAGKVILDNGALSLGTVTYFPDAEKGNTEKTPASSQIKPDGTYTLQTPAGFYKVAVTSEGMPTQMPAAGQAMPKALPINAKYKNAESSGLRVEVVPSPAPGTYDLKVTK